MLDLGQIAFEAYSEVVDGLSAQGEPLPDWGDLGDTIRDGWRCAAYAVDFALGEMDES